jgi:hypothetical protein
MDRRKALKKCGILLGTALSSSTIGVLFESFTSENEKNQVFFRTDEEILMNLLILLFQLQNSLRS